MKFTAAILENLRRLARLARTLGLGSAGHTLTLGRELWIVRKNYRGRVAVVAEEFKAGLLVVLDGLHYPAAQGVDASTGHIPGFQKAALFFVGHFHNHDLFVRFW